MPDRVVILRLHRELRLADHPALHRALQGRAEVVPAFIWSPEEEAPWEPGAASRWWLHRSLSALDRDLRERGSRLVLRRGPMLPALLALAREAGATAVVWTPASEPRLVDRDRRVRDGLQARGIRVVEAGSALLAEPAELRTGGGRSFEVFTPFWRALLRGPRPPSPLPAPRRIAAPRQWPGSVPLAELELAPRVAWRDGWRDAWVPGEASARARLLSFLDGPHARYAEERDAPGGEATSRLSPHLHWGELSVREAWWTALQHRGVGDGDAWLRQLAWREFAAHALVARPDLPERPVAARFRGFPWRRDRRALRAWQEGRTGYPLVDAGMRELRATGWMHGRVRMVVASFLVKHLLVRWQEGERWFWEALVDADLANNAVSWQWVAGCGHDASPWFRIFNPVAQSRRFDAGGRYLRRWLPELERLPVRHLHAPWLAPPAVLAAAGVVLGAGYPLPIVDHAVARARALAALTSIASPIRTRSAAPARTSKRG